jgi:hypothetical protein
MTTKSEESSAITPVDDATLQLHYDRKRKQYRTNLTRGFLVFIRIPLIIIDFYLWLAIFGYLLTFVPKPADSTSILLILIISLVVTGLITFGPLYLIGRFIPAFYIISAEDKAFLSLHTSYTELSEYMRSNDLDRQDSAVKQLKKGGRVIAESWLPGQTNIAKKTLDPFLAPIREMAPTRLPATAASDKKEEVESALSVVKLLLHYCYDPKDTAALTEIKTKLDALTGTEISSPGLKERTFFRYVFPALPAAVLFIAVELIGQSPGYDRTIILSISVIGSVSLYGILMQAIGRKS